VTIGSENSIVRLVALVSIDRIFLNVTGGEYWLLVSCRSIKFLVPNC
jgi:hypothetical protein